MGFPSAALTSRSAPARYAQEGSCPFYAHRLVVLVGGAHWQKSFQLKPNQRVTFTVDFEEPEE
jgi:hypothetical protein